MPGSLERSASVIVKDALSFDARFLFSSQEESFARAGKHKHGHGMSVHTHTMLALGIGYVLQPA